MLGGLREAIYGASRWGHKAVTARLQSWVESANSAQTDFPLNNLPYGVFSLDGETQRRCGVAIGDQVLDLTHLERRGTLTLGAPLLQSGTWNPLMAAGPLVWKQLRADLTQALSVENDRREALASALVAIKAVRLHLPFAVSEYTDFYASRHHAENVGTMFRGADRALPPNWLHMPIGYNGRASSVYVSGTDVVRPHGQLKPPTQSAPHFAPSARFDFELELGAIVGTPSRGPLSVAQADQHIFGYVLLNDWSARDIQAWEYQPLGPFQAKATATSLSPWIVTAAALEPFRVVAPAREHALLTYLEEPGPMLYDIDLSVDLRLAGTTSAHRICETNARHLYYSSAQQLAHHSASGCPMRVGDLLGSGTISGPTRPEWGSMLELSWGGQQPLNLGQATRTFLEDGDQVTLQGAARGPDFRVGFGACLGTVVPAQASTREP